MKISGIYKIENILTGDIYIGSAVDIKSRWRRHKIDLKKDKHHSIILQRAYNKYGFENFNFEILEECCKELLLSTEQKYLDDKSPKYNICSYAYNTLGRKDSEETKAKKRKYALDNNIKPPKETYEKIRKRVIMFKDGEEIKRFESLSEACRFLNKKTNHASSITRSIKRNIKAYGYNWKFF